MPKHSPSLRLQGLGVITVATALIACGTLPGTAPAPAPLKAATGAPLQNCAALATQFRFDQTQVTSATPEAAGALKLGANPVPAHCLVKDRKSTRLNSSHTIQSRMPSSA